MSVSNVSSSHTPWKSNLFNVAPIFCRARVDENCCDALIAEIYRYIQLVKNCARRRRATRGSAVALQRRCLFLLFSLVSQNIACTWKKKQIISFFICLYFLFLQIYQNLSLKPVIRFFFQLSDQFILLYKKRATYSFIRNKNLA
jgi:hypothetical protein